MTADDVAKAALRAMDRKQLYVVLPFQSRVHWYLKRLAPTWLLKKIARMFATGLKRAGNGPGVPDKPESEVARRNTRSARQRGALQRGQFWDDY